MKKSNFETRFERLVLKGDIFHGEQEKNVLFLHGAGSSERGRFGPIRNYMAQRGFGSVAFDFIGHGETGGDIHASSLKHRVAEASAVIKHLNMQEPLSLIGASMGAYIAVRIAAIYHTKNLILAVPGMYTSESYDVPFGPKFTEIIRKAHSWESSDAWEILTRFRGNLLVFVAGKDDVVPREIIERIDANASNTQSKEFLTFPESTHKILKYFAENPITSQTAAEKVISLL